MHTETTKQKIAKGVSAFYATKQPKPISTCKACGLVFYPRRTKYVSVACSRKCAAINKNAPARAIRSEFRNYQADCQFRFALKDYPERFNFSLIEQHGWYTAANRGGNLDGVSRDHMFSITDGFALRVDPELMRHPANCELVTQRNNSSKKGKSSISLDELKARIDRW